MITGLSGTITMWSTVSEWAAMIWVSESGLTEGAEADMAGLPAVVSLK